MHTAYIIKHTFQHEEDNVAVELSECLYVEIYTDAFIRPFYVHEKELKYNSLNLLKSSCMDN